MIAVGIILLVGCSRLQTSRGVRILAAMRSPFQVYMAALSGKGLDTMMRQENLQIRQFLALPRREQSLSLLKFLDNSKTWIKRVGTGNVTDDFLVWDYDKLDILAIAEGTAPLAEPAPVARFLGPQAPLPGIRLTGLAPMQNDQMGISAGDDDGTADTLRKLVGEGRLDWPRPKVVWRTTFDWAESDLDAMPGLSELLSGDRPESLLGVNSILIELSKLDFHAQRDGLLHFLNNCRIVLGKPATSFERRINEAGKLDLIALAKGKRLVALPLLERYLAKTPRGTLRYRPGTPNPQAAPAVGAVTQVATIEKLERLAARGYFDLRPLQSVDPISPKATKHR